VDIDREVRRLIEANTRDVSALAQGSLMAVVQFVVAMFILYYLLQDRSSLLRGVRTLLPLSADESDRVLRTAAGSIHANLHANFLTSVIDGVGGGLVFWLLGLPAPVTWGFVMFVLSFIPMFGTWLAWGPATAYLALSGNWGGAAGMLAWGLTSAFVVGWVIYTRLAGERMRLHPVPTLLAFLGGLAVFGVSGIVLGPVILAVTVAVLDVWRFRAAAERAADAATAPAPTNGQPVRAARVEPVPAG
jgi:predicted PurR-regulated permease PerM